MAFTKTVELPVTPDEAFALITQPERLRRWQAISAYVDLRVGGDYRWTVTPGHRAEGTFAEIEPGKRVVFGWGWQGGELAPDTSTVTITLEPTVAGTRVTLEHKGLTVEQATAHAEGWNHYFGRLEKLVSTGDAGPDEWARVPNPMNPITSAEAALAVLQPVLRRLTLEDQTKPTPYRGYDCHALAEHLFSSLISIGNGTGVHVVKPVAGTLEARVTGMTDQIIETWVERQGDTAAAAAVADAQTVLSLELLMHGWYFAQATAHNIDVSDELIAFVVERGVPNSDANRDVEGVGVHAGADARADAHPLDRLAAYSGRARH